jgi:hypothetical protein
VPETNRTDFLEILRVLISGGVEFIVVGGVSAVLQGAPISTFDLDVVHSTDRKNIEALLAALEQLEAYYRTQPAKRLCPQLSHLSSPGHQLLMTRFGPLDLLGAIGKGRDYEHLLPHSVQLEIEPGVTIRVLDLNTLITVKEETAGEKDNAMLPVLRRTLDERSKKT